ncbi:MAG TPA: sugar phosphate isomerase/epimerase family protein [Gemmatales bacterium]|nr:sugar phosphate isomerase/epimerase family protein [Gemmatales bacterium]
MNLAFSSNAYLNFSFADACRRIKGAGYAGIEIMADVPHAWPAYLLPEQKRDIRKHIDDNGLQISNVNAFMMNAINDHRQKYWHPSWIEPYQPYRQVRIDHTRRALDMAKELGAPCITTEPGGPLEPGQSWEDALGIFCESLRPVADHAQSIGVPLLVEPEPGLLIETAAQYERFASVFNHPGIGLNFDIGHMYCVKDDPATAIRQLAKHIRHVHLEDIDATRVHHHLVPGQGAIDFKPILQALKDVKYTGWVTIELYPYIDNPDNAAKAAFEAIKPLW